MEEFFLDQTEQDPDLMPDSSLNTLIEAAQTAAQACPEMGMAPGSWFSFFCRQIYCRK